MRHYRLSKSSHPQSKMVMYTSSIQDKVPCCQLHINGWTIPIEKYNTEILAKRKTKSIEYLSVAKLESDVKIVLYNHGRPSYHKFTISWICIDLQDIYTEADHLIIPLDDRFSYAIRSTLVIDTPHSV